MSCKHAININTSESAQPRNRSVVTRPFPCERVGAGHQTSVWKALSSEPSISINSQYDIVSLFDGLHICAERCRLHLHLGRPKPAPQHLETLLSTVLKKTYSNPPSFTPVCQWWRNCRVSLSSCRVLMPHSLATSKHCS